MLFYVTFGRKWKMLLICYIWYHVVCAFIFAQVKVLPAMCGQEGKRCRVSWPITGS